MEKSRVIFMGEKPLGLKCLQLLHERPEVELVAVCTRSRGEMWWGKQEILDYCAAEGIAVIPRAQILEHQVDHLISVLYPFIVEPELIRHARQGCYNLHEAPLPRWRGCNSYSHAILAGDSEYGTTLHEMAPDLDAGEIIAGRRFPIVPFETAKELYERTSLESYQLALEWFPRLLKGDYVTQPRPEGEPSFLNQRDSLAHLKELPLETELSRALKVVAALDFAPFEPGFVKGAGRKFYLFMKDSPGRNHPLIHGTVALPDVSRLGELPWGEFDCGVLRGPREMEICSEELYRQLFGT